MIKTVHCDPQHGFSSVGNLEDISDIIQNKDSKIWLDLESPSPSEMKLIAEEFNLHPLAVEDANNLHERPKVDEYENLYFVIFYSLSLDSDNMLHFVELDMFMGENFLVTVHKEPIKELAEAERRWKQNTAVIDKGIGVLLYSMLDSLVDNYFPVIDKLVEEVEAIEDNLFAQNARSTELTEEILNLKKKFLKLRRVISPERDVMNVLTRRDSPIFNEHTLLYFQDVYDHILRATDTIDTYRDQLASNLDATLAITSNQLNVVMRTMAAASIILMADALIAGVYGMNFDNIPELHWTFGYFGALALMVGVSVGIYLYFKARRWF